MNLPDSLLPMPWTVTAHLLYGLVLAVALWRAPWKRLGEAPLLHVYLGTTVAVLVLWQLQAGVLPGLNFHILGAALFTLMFGWPLAMVASSLVLLAVTTAGAGGWQAYSINALLMGVLPATVSWLVYRAVYRWLPRHLFVYIFACGYFGAALAMAATGLVSAGVFALSGVYPLEELLQHYLPYYLLMVFPEAILTGSFVALLAVYRPEWIWTYDEAATLRR
ncbi:MAG TPA: hypothetical protein DIC36_06915 [Gammaproteobacteria bacterium]|nr:hypothetical protein [Gammaproteobacteria bacterium]